MNITEPVTMWTDYAISIAALFFAVRLGRWSLHQKQRSIGLWALSFGGVALAAALGGTCHGFTLYLSRAMIFRLWYGMLYALGLSSFSMLAATVISTLPRRWHRWSLLAIGIKSVLYLVDTAAHYHFAYAIADYLSAMLIMLGLQVRAIYQRQAAAKWIGAGILLSGVAVAVQALGLAIGSFNANDLYHVVQLVALYSLYRGACLLKDR